MKRNKLSLAKVYKIFRVLLKRFKLDRENRLMNSTSGKKIYIYFFVISLHLCLELTDREFM